MNQKKELDELYCAARKCAAVWELGLEGRYSEDELMSIMGMLSYMENIERGYGHLNDEAVFASERRSGRLYEEAVRGFVLSKEYIRLRLLVKSSKVIENEK